jgi:hypothetical protein
MLHLEIVYDDGSHDHAWGSVEALERTIERAGQRVFELKAQIAHWSIYDA